MLEFVAFTEYSITRQIPTMRQEELCCKQTYSDDGVLTLEEWSLDGRLHRNYGPAVLHWNKFGDLTYKAWYFHGQMHRTDGGPAEIVWKDRNDDDVDVHTYNPEKVWLDRERWYLHGQLHRRDGPADVDWAGLCIYGEDWYLYGKRHRIDGPAQTIINLMLDVYEETWYMRGKVHRWDGPAKQFWDNSYGYDIEDMREHNDDWWKDNLKDTHYYIDGEQVTQEQHRRRCVLKTGREKVLRAARLLSLVPIVPHLPHDILSVVGGYLC